LRLVKVRYFSQPNLLAGRGLVPEFFQAQVTPQGLGAAVLKALEDRPRRAALEEEFRRVHRELRLGGAERAATAILQLIEQARASRTENPSR